MAAPSMEEFLRRLSALLDAGERVAVATVVSVSGSASAQPGAKAIIDDRGRQVFGWVGGGCAETSVSDEALRALEQGRPRLIRLDLDDEVLGVGMPCGGYMDLYIEPVTPAPRLLVLGHGLIAETLAKIAGLLEFRVAVNDSLASRDRFPDADERVSDDPEYAKVTCNADTFVVIATQHRSDYEALQAVLREPPAYVGLVASQKRSALLLERLYQDGVAPDVLRRISAPCGLDLEAATPQEIAVSILAEILQRRRGGSGRPLVEVKGVRLTDSGVELPPEPTAPARSPR